MGRYLLLHSPASCCYFSLSSARQPIRSCGSPPSFSRPSLIHRLGLGRWISGPRAWFGFSSTCCSLRVTEQEILPHPTCASTGSEWRSGGPRILPPAEQRSVWSGGKMREHRPEPPSPRATVLPARIFAIRASREVVGVFAHWA